MLFNTLLKRVADFIDYLHLDSICSSSTTFNHLKLTKLAEVAVHLTNFVASIPEDRVRIFLAPINAELKGDIDGSSSTIVTHPE